jgi:hypothetical protein
MRSVELYDSIFKLKALGKPDREKMIYSQFHAISVKPPCLLFLYQRLQREQASGDSLQL